MADTPSREALLANRLAQEIDRFKRNLEMYATDPADPSHKLSFHMTAEDAEAVLARLAAKPSDEGVREATIEECAKAAHSEWFAGNRHRYASELGPAIEAKIRALSPGEQNP